MTWVAYPNAIKRDQGHSRGPITPNQIVMHTMAGYLNGTDTFFNTNAADGAYSHFGVGGKWGSDASLGLDGVVYQWQSLDSRAEAQYEGNPYGFSIETADNAPEDPKDIEPWTPNQLASIIQLLTYLCNAYNIPAVLLPDTKATSKGIGYHEQGASWNVVKGGLAFGDHACPGPVREQQLIKTVIPAVAAALNPKATRGISLHVVVSLCSVTKASGVSSVATDSALYLNDLLRGMGYSAPASHQITPQTVAAYAAFQSDMGYTGSDADGVPGSSSLAWACKSKYGKSKGYTVTP